MQTHVYSDQGDHRGRDCLVVGCTLTVQPLHITTNVRLNPVHGEVYSI